MAGAAAAARITTEQAVLVRRGLMAEDRRPTTAAAAGVLHLLVATLRLPAVATAVAESQTVSRVLRLCTAEEEEEAYTTQVLYRGQEVEEV